KEGERALAALRVVAYVGTELRDELVVGELRERARGGRELADERAPHVGVALRVAHREHVEGEAPAIRRGDRVERAHAGALDAERHRAERAVRRHPVRVRRVEEVGGPRREPFARGTVAAAVLAVAGRAARGTEELRGAREV